MTPDPRDELAALTEPTPEQTARANGIIGATRITAAEAGLWDGIAFLPLDPAEAERPSIQRGPLGQPLAWDNIVTMCGERNPRTEQRPRSLYEGNWTPQEPG